MENEKPPLDLTGLGPYYQDEFKKIYESDENYKGKWNWWPFLFAWPWCVIKGCWGFAVMIILTFSVFEYKMDVQDKAFGIAVVLNLAWAIIMGRRGNWIYYNVKIKKKQFPPMNLL